MRLGLVRRCWPLILLCATLPYLTNLSGPYLFDDERAIRDNPYVYQANSFGSYFVGADSTNAKPNIFRPITFLSHRIAHLIGGGSTWPNHLFNILLHYFCGLLVVVLIREIAQLLGLNKHVSSFWLSLWVGIVFLTHPINAQVVNYQCDRSTILSSLFMLLATCAYVKLPRIKEVSKRHLLTGILIISFVASLLCKESGLALLPAFIIIDLLQGKHRTKRREYILRWCALCTVAGGYLLMRWQFFNTLDLGDAVYRQKMLLSRSQYLMTQTVIFWDYIVQTILPYDFYLFNAKQPVWRWSDFRFISAAVALLCCAIIALRNQRIGLWVVLVLGWMAANLAVTSSFIPLYLFYNPNRIYLATLMLLLFSGYILARHSQRKTIGAAMSFALFLTIPIATTVMSYKQSKLWSSAEGITHAMYKKAPASPATAFNYGKAIIDWQNPKRAEEHFRNQLEYFNEHGWGQYPKDPYKYHATMLEQLGLFRVDTDARAALPYFEKAVALWPIQARLWHNLATAQYILKDFKSAKTNAAIAKREAERVKNFRLLKKITKLEERLSQL